MCNPGVFVANLFVIKETNYGFLQVSSVRSVFNFKHFCFFLKHLAYFGFRINDCRSPQCLWSIRFTHWKKVHHLRGSADLELIFVWFLKLFSSFPLNLSHFKWYLSYFNGSTYFLILCENRAYSIGNLILKSAKPTQKQH